MARHFHHGHDRYSRLSADRATARNQQLLQGCAKPGALRGRPWQSGVGAIDSKRDAFTSAGRMDYLVNQAAVMNAHAALCPSGAGAPPKWPEHELAQLRQMPDTAKQLTDAAARALMLARIAAIQLDATTD